MIALLLVSFSDPYTIKRISDANFRYEFYTTNKQITPKANKIYFWFKGGLIHSAQSGIAGNLLNEKFIKMYHSNQLAEQGEFRNGLKVGLWKTWHENGIVQTTQYWNNGLKTGIFYHFDANGNVLEKGNFKKDKKHGEWIDYATKVTVRFKNGIVVPEKIKYSKEEIAKLKEDKKKAEEAKKAARKAKKIEAKAGRKSAKDKNESSKIETNTPKKENFFTRLFNKKQPKQNTNGQGT